MFLKLLPLSAAAALVVAAATQQLMWIAALATAGEALDGHEAIQRGAAAYTQLMRESLDTGEAQGCWQHVAEQLMLLQHLTHEDACSARGEAFRELIALTRMRCIYTRSHRPFPGPKEGCYLFPEEVPKEWLTDPAAKAAAIAAGLPPEAAEHPCVQLHGVLLQLQEQQQLQELEWEDIQNQPQHDEGSEAGEAANSSNATAATAQAAEAEAAAEGRDLIYRETHPLQALELRRLQLLHQQLRRSCNELTQRQAAACQQQDMMEFGTFALVREQINHIGKARLLCAYSLSLSTLERFSSFISYLNYSAKILLLTLGCTDNICFFLHSAERQRRSEESAARLSAASVAATSRMQEQLRQLQHMEQLQQQLQLQQLQGGSYMQQLLQQLQQGMEDTFAVLQQLKAFHRAVGEWLGGTETLLVYGAGALAALILTSSSRVAAARLKVLGLICVATAAELALHHGALSPYLLELTQQHQKQRTSVSAEASLESTAKSIFNEVAWGTVAALTSGVAVHGVSVIRWTCLLASCWLWMRSLLSYTSPEQQLQMQLQHLQLQVSGVRSELHQAQQAGDPRMQEVQQLLQQLLHCVAEKGTEMRLIQQQEHYHHHQRQQQEEMDGGEEDAELSKPEEKRPLRRRFLGWLVALTAAVSVALISTAFAAASALALAVWGSVVYMLRLWRRRRDRNAEGVPQSSSVDLPVPVSPTGAAGLLSASTGYNGGSSSTYECSSRDAPVTLMRRLQPGRQGLRLPEGLRQQSRKNNEDEGEEADPTYKPSSSSSSSRTSNSTSPSEARSHIEDSAGHEALGEPVDEQQQNNQQRQRRKVLQEEQQERPQPLRRNPPRKCRVANYAKIDEPQHPDVFMREVVPPARLKALQRRSSPGSPASLTKSSCSSSPVTTPRLSTPLPKGTAARSATAKPTPTPVKKEQQPQQQQRKQQEHKVVSPAPPRRGRAPAASQ
ncbi:hypothetical protein Emed_000602 [Eimeria media]